MSTEEGRPMQDPWVLIFRFDCGRIKSSEYGVECWKQVWTAIDAQSLSAVALYEGDSPETLGGMENVFCIGLMTFLEEMYGKIFRKRDSPLYLADRPIVYGPSGVALCLQALAECGSVTNGQIVGSSEATMPRRGLEAACEIRRAQQEEERRKWWKDHDERVRAEEERIAAKKLAAENARRAAVQEGRKVAYDCVMCGFRLTLIDRFLGRDRHAGCNEFRG